MSDRPTQILEAAVRVIARRGVRGLRVEELAAEAEVSTALIYYHFGDRAGLMRRTLDHISQRAGRYTEEALAVSADPRTQLAELLLLELQDKPEVKENSTAWGELRATAVFEADLRGRLAESTREWIDDVTRLILEIKAAGAARQEVDPAAAAERLTALVEGLSERWLSGSMSLDRARELVRGAIGRELGPA